MDEHHSPTYRVLILSKQLPMEVRRSDSETDYWILERDELDPTLQTMVILDNEPDSNYQFFWIGSHLSGYKENVFPNEREAFNRFLEKENCNLIAIDDQLYENWQSFSSQILWTLLNTQLEPSTQIDHAQWKTYKQINRIYTQYVVDLLSKDQQSNYLIFVNDFHLMLLPGLIRESIELPRMRIGYFSHPPWPTNELFRILPMRETLLSGLLSSDLIGFQTYHDGRYFISCCTRLLDAIDPSPTHVMFHGRRVRLVVNPTGIHPGAIERILANPGVSQKAKQFLSRLPAGLRIIVACDRLDPTKGILQKIAAFELFLKKYPEWQGKVSLFQISLPGTESLSTEIFDHLQCQINEAVGRVNGPWTTVEYTPIHFLSNATIEDMCALFLTADIGLFTPLRDGMNLESHAYVICQNKGKKSGPLILSEFTGSAESLSGALIVNPCNYDEVAGNIREALLMDDQEKGLRHEYNYKTITRFDALAWGTKNLRELQESEQVTLMTRLLKTDLLKASYESRNSRLFLLDYDGTLTRIVKHPSDALPSFALKEYLRQLSRDSRNRLYIISGRDRNSLTSIIGDLPIGLCCEHGLFIRPHGSQEWIENEVDRSWKQTLLPVLKDYTDRTPGSCLEEKEVNISWQYRNAASKSHAQYQAKELVHHLQDMKLPITMLIGKKHVEVRAQGLNKGVAVREILRLNPDVDWLLCVGDDTTDEEMFVVANAKASEQLEAFTCAVGRKNSSARFYVESQRDVLKALKVLSEGTR